MLCLCDLSKAFNVVSHCISQTCKYEIGGTVLQTTSGYLADRKQIVSLAGFSSSVKLIEHGLPQGTGFGPLLFTLHLF